MFRCRANLKHQTSHQRQAEPQTFHKPQAKPGRIKDESSNLYTIFDFESQFFYAEHLGKLIEDAQLTGFGGIGDR